MEISVCVTLTFYVKLCQRFTINKGYGFEKNFYFEISKVDYIFETEQEKLSSQKMLYKTAYIFVQSKMIG